MSCFPKSIIVHCSYLSELGWIRRALNQSNEAGVIKKTFLHMCLGERVKEYDGRISNVLQAFQVCPRFAIRVTLSIVTYRLHWPLVYILHNSLNDSMYATSGIKSDI